MGDLPSSTVTYVGENAGFIQLSESATTSQPANIPILNKKNSNVLSNKSVNIPTGQQVYENTLIPAQATVEISTSSSLASGILNLENEKMTSFNITLNVEREEVNLLGHKIPQDRKIKYPLGGEASIKMICDDKAAGDLNAFIKEDAKYNVTTTFKNDSNQDVLIWNIREAMFSSISYSESIGSNKTTELGLIFDGLDIGVSGVT